jgi:GYF domain 2
MPHATCPACKLKFRLSENPTGQRFNCPGCGRAFMASPRQSAAANHQPTPAAWYMTRDGKTRHGPYSDEELIAYVKAGRLLPDDMLLRVGSSAWVPARSILPFNATPAPVELAPAVQLDPQFEFGAPDPKDGEHAALVDEGESNPRPRQRQFILFASIVALVSLFLVVSVIVVANRPEPGKGMAEENPDKGHAVNSPTKKAIHVTAEELVIAYETNWNRADQNFRAKVLDVEITGQLEHSETGRYFFVSTNQVRLVERPFVPQRMQLEDVRGEMQNALANAKYLPAVYMHLKPSAAARFERLELSGIMRLTIRGTCQGAKEDSSTRPDFLVTFEDCEIIAGR